MKDTAAASPLPVVVPMGFSGVRALFEGEGGHGADPVASKAFHEAVLTALKEKIQAIHSDLGLKTHHFLCGVSQIAIGGDTLFTRACQDLSIPQRIFLPQPREDFLTAKGKKKKQDAFSTPEDQTPPPLPAVVTKEAETNKEDLDFELDQRKAAEDLLASKHIIQERVICHSDDRDERFHVVGHEIVNACEIFICMVLEDPKDPKAERKSRFTQEMIEAAQSLGKPILKIVLGRPGDKSPFKSCDWLPRPYFEGQKAWSPPAMPETLLSAEPEHPVAQTPASSSKFIAGYLATEAMDNLERMMKGSNLQATHQSSSFKKAAWLIVGTHFLATVLATFALAGHGPADSSHGGAAHHADASLEWLLIGELTLLISGFLCHWHVHRKHVVRTWSTARAVTEICRSVKAMANIHSQLEYLFTLPFSPALRPLLRTLHTFHLAASREARTWDSERMKEVRSTYDKERVNDQIGYYDREQAKAGKWRTCADILFYTASVTATLCTFVKLLAVTDNLPCALHQFGESLPGFLGMLAIILPVAAVGVLSLAASFDLEARVHTYRDILSRLKEHRSMMKMDAGAHKPLPKTTGAQPPAVLTDLDEATFIRLALRTEALLLGETANWASRRFFTGIS